MPSKKRKYNARFPVGRIKKIMQSDEEVGKVAQAVPIIICGASYECSIQPTFSSLPRTLELFVESLLTKTLKITNSRNAKTLSTSHMKQCIMSEQRFDFLRELVRNIPDISVAEEAAAGYNEEDNQSSPEEQYADSDTPYDLSMPSTSVRATIRQLPHQHQHPPPYQYNHHQHPMNGQNGKNVTGNDHPRNYLKRSMSSNTNSVIMHTTALANVGSGLNSTECLPAKLSRSESNPVPPQHPSQAVVHHPRLKHQSYSMPSNCVPTNNNNNSPNIPPKQISAPSQTAIVSIDYCSKPVVKIDYSNISLTAAATPLSAPAHISSMSANNNSAFNFTAEPVINIDLSNIVSPSATNASVMPSGPQYQQQSRNSKASMAEPFTSPSIITNSAQQIPTMTASTIANSSSSLELDEDYDNI